MGVEIIMGAAGSGKTTTALLRLRSLVGFHASRRERLGDKSPLRALVLTYNRTLRGYIDTLIKEEARRFQDVELTVATFGHWAWSILGKPSVLDEDAIQRRIAELGRGLGLPLDFFLDEVDYLLGRFLPSERDLYLTAPRVGRGRTPRVDRTLRQRILSDVIEPFEEWKVSQGGRDWNDLAVQVASTGLGSPIDIVVADETQDFSANQIRAILRQLAAVHTATFVLDAAQRIYARGFNWTEVGLTIRPENVHRLAVNYRNTVEIAKFAVPLLQGLPLEDDGAMPDFTSCRRHGPKPTVLKGRYHGQLGHAIARIEEIDLDRESVAFLHPKGGGWFHYTRRELRRADFPFVEITRQSEWPAGDENIALSTLHSAKGLEFDHVFILGLSPDTMSHGEDDEDDRLGMLRRLLAMAIGRARVSVILGYKPGEASKLIDFLEPETYNEVDV